MPQAVVLAVHKNQLHGFSKQACASVELVAGHGVLDDAHFGVAVKHRSRVAKDPTQPNLRQVHLLHEELFAQLAGLGQRVLPGELGENITTRGIDLLALGTGTRLRLGAQAMVEITGLRNPCAQIESFQPGLLAAVLGRAADGSVVRKTGVMAIVVESGVVRADDAIEVAYAPLDFRPLVPV
jgi:MOSC domain-containing protein YiiM